MPFVEELIKQENWSSQEKLAATLYSIFVSNYERNTTTGNVRPTERKS